ncbi:hypothetical protein Pmani_026221 [Petrolisthes manimaculis]|uniref:Uncharacterized protein n=2 Tax=Petrolisthes manimaculis TaxID=1843537 RepID=A0AAE1P6G3_9EUCA|nr:hypothetical protein Pmani_026221 [Petrolisthes manimaculis]
MVSSVHVEPVSRTDQYKRVMKPMLERKRRARINRCLDELRDLLVAALQAEGETVTRLEKADILELTVRHVRRLNQRRALTLPPTATHDPRHDALKFQQGFVAAAQQVQSFLVASPSLEPSVSSRLITHLTSCASAMTGVASPPPPPTSQGPPAAPTSPSPPPPSAPTAVSMVAPRPAPMCRPVMVPSTSPPMSPPPLMDLSMKAPRVVVAPTPIRDHNVPQDLSMRRPLPQQEEHYHHHHHPDYSTDGKTSWRPWAARDTTPAPAMSRLISSRQFPECGFNVPTFAVPCVYYSV